MEKSTKKKKMRRPKKYFDSAEKATPPTQSVRQNYTSVYSFDCNGAALSHHCYSDRMSVVLNSIGFLFNNLPYSISDSAICRNISGVKALQDLHFKLAHLGGEFGDALFITLSNLIDFLYRCIDI